MTPAPTLLQVYREGLRRFWRFHQVRHPREMGSQEINAFLTHLAVEDQIKATTQNQATAELLFLFRHVLEIDHGDLDGVVRAPPEAVAGGAQRGGS